MRERRSFNKACLLQSAKNFHSDPKEATKIGLFLMIVQHPAADGLLGRYIGSVFVQDA